MAREFFKIFTMVGLNYHSITETIDKIHCLNVEKRVRAMVFIATVNNCGGKIRWWYLNMFQNKGVTFFCSNKFGPFIRNVLARSAFYCLDH